MHSVHRHIYVLYAAIVGEYLHNVILVYIPSQLPNVNFCWLWLWTLLSSLWRIWLLPFGGFPSPPLLTCTWRRTTRTGTSRPRGAAVGTSTGTAAGGGGPRSTSGTWRTRGPRSTARGIFPLSLPTPLWSALLPFPTFALTSDHFQSKKGLYDADKFLHVIKRQISLVSFKVSA